jgi:hypothetical protein
MVDIVRPADAGRPEESHCPWVPSAPIGGGPPLTTKRLTPDATPPAVFRRSNGGGAPVLNRPLAQRRRPQPETAAFLLPLQFVLDNPSRVAIIGDTSYVTIQSHVVADSKDLAGFAVKTGASL